jgi:hypothetical protein
MMKKVPSIRELENNRETFKKLPMAMGNKMSGFQEMMMGFPRSGNVVSLRVI